MEKERVRLMDIQSELDRILRIRKFTDNEIALIESDLIEGLSTDDITQYAKTRHSVRWMKLISDCMRAGLDRAVIDYLCKEEQNLDDADVVYHLVQEQVPIEVLEKNYENSKFKNRMMELFLNITDHAKQDEKQEAIVLTDNDLTQVQKSEQEPKSEQKPQQELEPEQKPGIDQELQQKPETEQKIQQEPESGKRQEKDRHKSEVEEIDIVKQEYTEMLAQNNAVISSQQDRINEASAKISQLQKEKEQYLAEQDQYIREKEKSAFVIREQEKQILELQEQLTHLKEQNSKVPILTGQDMRKPVAAPDSIGSVKMDSGSKILTEAGNHDYTIMDKKQGISCPVEITRAKPERVGLIASLFLKKKSQRDIMQRAIEGELDKNQLLQVKVAMEKGLSEDQLCQLISCKVPADRMPELIEIAVLENEMGYHD